MEDPTEADSWSITENRTVRFTHKWTITNFSTYFGKYYKNKHPQVDSPNFSPTDYENLKFNFQLFPNGVEYDPRRSFMYEDVKEHVALQLNFCENLQLAIIKCEMSILNKRKLKTNTQTLGHFIRTKGRVSSWQKFVSHQELLNKANGLLPDDTLTIFCEIEAILDPISTSGNINQLDKRVESQLIGDFSQLFETRRLSDVILVTGKTDIDKKTHRAHKAILGARSEVFAAMFEHDMKESKECRVDIEDIEDVVLHEMLRFIYTGKVSNLANLASDLLVAADKYGLTELKNQCEQHLIHNLTHENVIAVLFVADEHSAAKLRTSALEYINKNQLEIMDSDYWKEFEKKPKQCFALFSMMAGKRLKRKLEND